MFQNRELCTQATQTDQRAIIDLGPGQASRGLRVATLSIGAYSSVWRTRSR